MNSSHHLNVESEHLRVCNTLVSILGEITSGNMQEWEIASAKAFLERSRNLLNSKDSLLAIGYIKESERLLDGFKRRVAHDLKQFRSELIGIFRGYQGLETHALFGSDLGRKIQGQLAKVRASIGAKNLADVRSRMATLRKDWVHFQFLVSIYRLYEDCKSVRELDATAKEKILSSLREDNTDEALARLNRYVEFSVANQCRLQEDSHMLWHRYDLFRRYCKPKGNQKGDFREFWQKMRLFRRTIEAGDYTKADILSIDIGNRYVQSTTCKFGWHKLGLKIKGFTHPYSNIQCGSDDPNFPSETVSVDAKGFFLFNIELPMGAYRVTLFNQTFNFIAKSCLFLDIR